MHWLSKKIDRTADSFGSLPFIVFYNIITVAWVFLGIFAPWFPDRYPSNFYTMLVSWLAINMSSLLLYVGKRQQARERAEEEHKLQTLDALLTLAQADEERAPLIRMIADNQVSILEHLSNLLGDHHAMKKQHTALIHTLQRFIEGDDHTGT